ncbi:hypothetical protein IFT48_01755 [Pseudomonas fluorescens]|uniref:hypothetical protein n=1 Tax=Pseudomonas fluorescens TaxID=294 RepID=UPI001930ABFA|nr:hypothetical protein [Pseudomonas fluorescens]MBD8088686.1 hypothetical protein [Pseudomonas fluorescens]
MLIIREKPDYYDSAIGYGVDKTVVYQRKTRVAEDPSIIRDIKIALGRAEERNPFLRRSKFVPFHVGFCGKVYTGAYTFENTLTGEMKGSLFRDDGDHWERRHFWVEKDYPARELDEKGRSGLYLWDGNRPVTKTLREWLSKMHQGIESMDVFLEHRLVSFVAIDRQIVLEPCLKDLNFQRMMGGVEAFQEIMMFISGVLGMLERETSVTEDKYIALSKGFDARSFRKDPTKHF